MNRTGNPVRITKRGSVIAELRAPYDLKPTYSGPGAAKLELTIDGDIMEPTGVIWAATAKSINASLATSDRNLRILDWIKLAY